MRELGLLQLEVDSRMLPAVRLCEGRNGDGRAGEVLRAHLLKVEEPSFYVQVHFTSATSTIPWSGRSVTGTRVGMVCFSLFSLAAVPDEVIQLHTVPAFRSC